MTDNEIIQEASEAVEKNLNAGCYVGELLRIIKEKNAEIEKLNVDLVGMRGACESYKMHYDNAQAEIERLQKLQKPTKTSGFIIQNGKVVFYSNMLNGYRHEYKDLDEVVKELNLMLQSCYKCDEVVSHYKGNLKIAKSEAYREFAGRFKQKYDKPLFYLGSYEQFMYEVDNLVKELTESNE